MRKHEMVFMMTLALSAAACLSGAGVRPYRLYPPAPQALGPEQVSTLALIGGGTGVTRGQIGLTGTQFVDDKDVSSLGGYFELLPGCHIITTPTPPWSRYGGGAIAARWTFALPMRPGHQYRIEVRPGAPMWSTGRFTIQGYESDLRGKQTREFEPATSPKDIEACNKEAGAYAK
jgi:hypothetical protein